MQIHGTNSKGKPVLKKRVSRDNFLCFMANVPKCLIGMEACSAAHHWAKKLLQYTLSLEKLAKEDDYCQQILD